MKKSIIAIFMAMVVLTCVSCTKTTADKASASSKTPVKTVKTGVVIEASMHNVEIEAPDGTTYTFTINDKTKVEGDGDNIGNTVEISFDGEYKESVPANLIKTTKTPESKPPEKVDSKAPEKPAPTPTPAPEPVDENGTSDTYSEYGDVVEVTDTSITIITNDNDEYTFVRNSDTLVNADMSVGAAIEVRFTGDINNYPVAEQIAPPQ